MEHCQVAFTRRAILVFSFDIDCNLIKNLKNSFWLHNDISNYNSHIDDINELFNIVDLFETTEHGSTI